MFNYTVEQKYNRLQKELIGGGVALASIFLIGTLWYWLVEKWPWFDAAYMTIITLATVGYGETHPLEERGRLFTIGLILMGLITIGYIVNRFTEAIIQGYFQDGIRLIQEKRLIDSLNAHYILCGFGRTGRQIAQEFSDEGIQFIIIDSNVEQIETIKQLGYMAIQGDATLDEYLLQAKIDKAICLVAALTSDAENLYTVLSAKTLNPQIRVIARASTEEAVKKIQRAGADAVVSPYITGGRRLAAAALRPQVMDFVEGIFTGSERSYYLEEFLVDEQSCPYVNKSLSEARLRSQSGALVLGIRRLDSAFIAGPTGDTHLLAGDLLICMGTAEQLRQLNRILAPTKGQAPRIPRQSQGE